MYALNQSDASICLLQPSEFSGFTSTAHFYFFTYPAVPGTAATKSTSCIWSNNSTKLHINHNLHWWSESKSLPWKALQMIYNSILGYLHVNLSSFLLDKHDINKKRKSAFELTNHTRISYDRRERRDKVNFGHIGYWKHRCLLQSKK